MNGEFKQCPNGHYYQGATCPYCKGTTGQTTETMAGFGGADNSTKTLITPGAGGNDETLTMGGGDSNKTRIVGEPTFVDRQTPSMSNRTVFGEDEEIDAGGVKHVTPRTARKLVGWLVSYDLDPMGVDFKIYEGRNIIGRDATCNITVNDGMVSGEHAILLFRAGKFSITDRQSSHGTFVNGEDIDLEPRYIQDGDIITVGKTRLKFKVSLF